MRLPRSTLLAVSFAFAVLCSSGSPSQAWVRCSGEGGDCVMNSSGRNLVRYGADQGHFILETSGTNRLGCNNDVFGDPAHGADKACDYMPAPPRKETWRTCAQEGGTCRLPNDQPRHVRYGAGNSFIYKIQSGSFPCNNDLFPDIARGQGKHCEFSDKPFSLGTKALAFRDCGTEYTQCGIGDGTDTALLRYGVGQAWEYRLAIAANIQCGNDAFHVDRARGDTKFCQVASLPPQIVGVVGRWHFVSDCTNCSTLARQVQVGVSGTRSETVTKGWAQEVSATYESSATFSGLGEKASITAKISHSETTAITNSLTRQKAETTTATCTSQPTQRLAMYQWEIDVDELCYVRDGQCRSTVSQFRLLCAPNPPRNYQPICPPSMCLDTLCTKCAS